MEEAKKITPEYKDTPIAKSEKIEQAKKSVKRKQIAYETQSHKHEGWNDNVFGFKRANIEAKAKTTGGAKSPTEAD